MFVIHFLVIFILILIYGYIFKPSALNSNGIVRALFIAFGYALAWLIVDKKFINKK